LPVDVRHHAGHTVWVCLLSLGLPQAAPVPIPMGLLSHRLGHADEGDAVAAGPPGTDAA
jgi:hypothetical protein